MNGGQPNEVMTNVFIFRVENILGVLLAGVENPQ